MQITENDIALINKYARKNLTEDDLYIFPVVLCDNEIDRDNECFSDDSLEKMAELFVGVTGIYDHDPSAKNQVARIYECHVETDPNKKTSYGTLYKKLSAKAYITKCKSNENLIAMLDSGITKEVSVGCSIQNCTCSICGKNMRKEFCHAKGKTYKNKLCFGILENPNDAYEWSFTAVPAQKSAGVTKSFSYQNNNYSNEYIDLLKQQASEGEKYKSFLRGETVKVGVTAKLGIKSEILEKMTQNLNVEELLYLKGVFEKSISEKLPIKPQTLVSEDFTQYGTKFIDKSKFNI